MNCKQNGFSGFKKHESATSGEQHFEIIGDCGG